MVIVLSMESLARTDYPGVLPNPFIVHYYHPVCLILTYSKSLCTILTWYHI